MNNKATIHVSGEDVKNWSYVASVTLNGKKFSGACRAKSGKNGFVETLKWSMDSNKLERHIDLYGEFPLKKVRGNVKISFKPKGDEQ